MNKLENANQDFGTLMKSLSKAGRLVDNELEAALSRLELSIAKLDVLKALVQAEGPLPLGQIAERLACVRSNVTQLVDNLEAGGLVRRVPDPEDRRSIRAAITEEGRSKYAAGLKEEAKTEGELFGRLSPVARDQLLSLLRQFSSSLRRLV